MRYTFITLLLLFTSACYAQQNYDVASIPKELLSHASAVIRENAVVVDIKSMDAVTQHTRYIVTVLNKNGDEEAAIHLSYDKTDHISSVKGMIYNDLGKTLVKFTDRDFSDRSDADGFSLFVDDRVKYYRPAITTYPYTVDYDIVTTSKQTLLLPDWSPNRDQSIGTSVEHSTFSLTCKDDLSIRYKELNFPGKVITSSDKGIKTYLWEISGMKAQRDEPYSPTDDKLYPSVKIAPEKFSYGDISGSFANWQEYGSFIYDKLLKSRRQLPPETIANIQLLTKDISDPKLKAEKIYEYMQQKTRYVSVQIGIGGYQPFLASDVDKQSYGDCKALVNYTQSLLATVGIDSYYVLNMAGSTKQSALPDFASMNQFNHVILCLPFKNDTTWIDCTSKENPFGYLGDFTDDRLVVACTPTGGKLMHTPKYPPETNKQTRQATFTLAADGMLTGQMTTAFKGTQYDNREHEVNETFAEQVKKVKEIYPIENLDISAYTLTQNKSLDPVTTETIKLNARDYMAQNGGRYFFLPNIASRYIKPIKQVMNRTNDVYINRGYVDIDEVAYDLPDGFDIKTKPLNVVLDQPFGKYNATAYVTGRKLIYKRTLQINNGTYSKDVYNDLVDFFQSVADADNYTIAMEKK